MEIVGHLLAVQAQELRSAKLALWARGSGFGASDVDTALEDGSLVVASLMRGTLHLVRTEDWPWLHALTAPRQRATSVRRLGQLGVAEEQAARGVEVIRRAVAEQARTRKELAALLAAEGIPTEGQATPHLIFRAALDGVVVLCGEQRFRAAPPVGDVDRDEALRELATRYLRGHAPAGAADLATWSGLPLTDVRPFVTATDVDAPARIPPRALPAFDPYLLGWKDRSFAVPEKLRKAVHPGGGMLRAVTTKDGLVTGTWSLTDPPDADITRFLDS